MDQSLVNRFRRDLRAQNKSGRTIEAYTRDINQMLGDLPKRLHDEDRVADPLRLSSEEIYDWFIDIQDERGWAPSTLNRKRASLMGFFGWLNEHDLRSDSTNPVARIKQAKENRNTRKFLEPEEVASLLSELQRRTIAESWVGLDEEEARTRCVFGLAIYVCSGLMYYRGLRVSEIVNLERSHVTPLPSDDLRLEVPRKGNTKNLAFIVHPEITGSLYQYLGWRREFGGRNPRFFINPRTERPLTRFAVYNELKDAGQYALGPEKGSMISPHWLRHSLARHLLDMGHDLALVRDTLNHKNIKTTSIYIDSRNEEIDGVLRGFTPDDVAAARRKKYDG